jgi:hypothetical protein
MPHSRAIHAPTARVERGKVSQALVQTPILSAMWNDIGQRIQRATNLQIRIEAQFAPEPIREALEQAMAHLDAVLRARDA